MIKLWPLFQRIQISVKPRFEILAVLSVWLIALFLRLYQLEHVMPFTFDQGRDLLELSKIRSGDITLIGPTTGIAGFFLGPFYFYALLPGFILGEGSPIGLAYWVALVASLALPVAYLVGKQIGGRVSGWVSVLLLTFLPGSLQEARVIWNPTFAVPLLALSWWCLFASKKKSWLILPALFLYGLALQTELAYVIFLAPAYLWWMVIHSPLALLWQKMKQVPVYSWQIICAALLLAATTLVPQLIFELKHGFIMTNSVINTLSAAEKSVPYSVIWDQRPKVISSSLESLLFARVFGSKVLFAALLVGLGVLIASPKARNSRFVQFLLLVTWLPIAGMMLFRGNGGNFFDYYLNPHYLPIVLLLGFATTIFQKQWQKISYLSFLAVICLVVFFRTASVIYFPEKLDYTYQKQVAAFEYALAQTTSQPATLEIFVPNLRPEQYVYFNEWYARTNDRLPAQINQNLTSDQQVILLYEPGFRGGSLSAFRSWYRQQRQDATCQPPEVFGLITVEACYRATK